MAIITGASSGIGRAVAVRAAARGYRVVLVARRVARLESLAQAISARGGQALVVPGDVAVLDDQRRIIASTVRAFGGIDVLFNNAGMPLAGPFHAVGADALRRQWDVNVTAVATFTRLALPYLAARRGVVVNIGSALSRLATPGMGNYSPTKIAVTALTEALRRELAPLGVRVCLVEPGPVATEFHGLAGRTQMLPARLVLRPAALAGPIVALFDHPRRRLVVPAYLRPALALLDAVARLAPPLADWLAATYARRGRGPR